MQNPWISYIDRSYQQIKAAILNKITNPTTGIPEMVDHSEGNDFVKLISIWAGIAEMQGYYLDARARETFITKALKFKSAVKIARMQDYRVRGAFPSYGKVRFTLSEVAISDINIPSGTKIQTEESIEFLTTESVILPSGGTYVDAPVKQWTLNTLPTVISDGLGNQIIEIDSGVVDNGIIVQVDSVQWGSVESFYSAINKGIKAIGYFDIATGTVGVSNEITNITVDGVSIISAPVLFDNDNDTTAQNVATEINSYTSTPNYTSISFGSKVLIIATSVGVLQNEKEILVTVGGNVTVNNITDLAGGEDESGFDVFRAMVNEDAKMTVEFGDGINGAIPPGSSSIDINYYTTVGESGNIAAGLINTIVSSISVPNGSISVSNPLVTNGGVDQENLTVLKKNIPLASRTRYRAVTEQDYIDIAKLAPGVHNAAADFQCGKSVNVYVLPYGGGIATVDFMVSVSDYFDDKRMLTTNVDIKAVGEVRLLLSVMIYVLAGYNQETVKNNVETNLLELLSWKNALIKSRLLISDLYEVIENTEGVKNSIISGITIKPYAEPIGSNTKVLNWTRELINTGTTQLSWYIKMTSATNYNLFKETLFVGSFTVGVEVIFPEIRFTVSAGVEAYVNGDNWIFRTYPTTDLNAGKIELDEYSIITAFSGDLTLTTG